MNTINELNSMSEKIEKVVEDTKKLNEEINARQSFKEEFEQTLCARWQAKEITWEEFKQTIIKHNISIPINLADEEDTQDMFDGNCDLYSNYEHYVYKGDTYYSVMNKDFKWKKVFKNNGKYRFKNWKEKQFYERNAVDKDGLQLAFDYDENGCNLLVYKNYELLGYYLNGNIENVKKLVEYDDRLDDEDLENYGLLLWLLDMQREEYLMILKADEMLRKKFNFIKCKYKKFSSFANENPKRVY